MFNLSIELRSKRILIIDDLVEARSSLKKMMVILGAVEANIDTAANGQEAAQLIAENDYQIVLADYNLQRGKDGQQVLEEARYSKRLKASSLFIMITAENAVEMVMGALEYDPDSYLTKPYTLNMLKERLQRILILKQRLADINQAIDKQNIELAIGLSEEMLVKKPKLIMPLTRILGKLYIKQKEYEKALQSYLRLLDQRDVSWARLGQAICIFHLGNPQTALELLQQSLHKHPLYVQCYDWSATILLAMNEPIKAQQQLQKAIEISPKAVLRQIQLGRVAFANADYTAALQALEQAIKLGRLSCYKNPDVYLMFAQAAQALLATEWQSDAFESLRLVNKAISYGKEVKLEYSDKIDVLFDSAAIDSHIYLITDDTDQALLSVQQAEQHLEEIIQPGIERQLQMAELLIKTRQDVRAKKLLTSIKKSTDTQKEYVHRYVHRIAALEASLNQDSIEEHIRQLNSQGIELYSQKDYRNAVIFFDNATAHTEASTSVLLNAIQTKISAIETEGININYLKDCHSYFNRIGSLDPSDKRYDRYQQLKHSFSQLWQKAGLN